MSSRRNCSCSTEAATPALSRQSWGAIKELYLRYGNEALETLERPGNLYDSRVFYCDQAENGV